MTSSPFDGQTFQTASARRKGKVLTFRVEHLVTDGDGNIEDVSADLRIDPLVDVVRLASMFGSLGKVLRDVNTSGDTDHEAMLAALETALPKARNALREAIVPNDRAKFDKVAPGIDASLLAQIVRGLTSELSGLDPTPVPSSSTGSPETGSGSTDGAPVEASTPVTSPPLEG